MLNYETKFPSHATISCFTTRYIFHAKFIKLIISSLRKMYYKAVHACAMLNVAYSSFNFAPTIHITYSINSNKSVNLENVIFLSINEKI